MSGRGQRKHDATQPSGLELPLETGHVKESLGGHSVRGAAVTTGAQAVRFMLHTLSTMVLARLLTPADFGLVAMVAPIVGFATMFADAGLSMATVQRAEITDAQVSALFWVNVALSLGLGLAVAGLAPCVAWFYGEPRLFPITAALALALPLTGLGIQHKALLMRWMRFKTLAGVSVWAELAGITAAVAGAAAGLSYWALVLLAVSQAGANTCLMWWMCSWRPKRPGRLTGVRSMLQFGGKLTAFNSINHWARNADNILIGWAWGPTAVGLYSKAYRLLLLPITQINGPILAVALPALSRLQAEPEKFRRYYLRAVQLAAAAVMPLVVLCALASADLVLLVLGPQWLEAVPICHALAPAAFIGTLNVSFVWLFVPLGRVGRQFSLGVVFAALAVGAFVVGLQFGALGVAICFSIQQCLCYFPGIIYACAGTPVSARDLLLTISVPAVGALATGSGLFFALPFIQAWVVNPVVRIIIIGLVYFPLYVGATWACQAILKHPERPNVFATIRYIWKWLAPAWLRWGLARAV